MIDPDSFNEYINQIIPESNQRIDLLANIAYKRSI
jgi:hypothetical protein